MYYKICNSDFYDILPFVTANTFNINVFIYSATTQSFEQYVNNNPIIQCDIYRNIHNILINLCNNHYYSTKTSKRYIITGRHLKINQLVQYQLNHLLIILRQFLLYLLPWLIAIYH